MNFDVSAFNKLRAYTFIIFKKEPRKKIPKQIKNPVGAIVIFARFMGLTHIPVKTVEKLRTDPYFRYCFYLLKRHGSIYDKTSSVGEPIRRRLVALLKDPAAMTDNDLFCGLQWYLNNFIQYLPGGMYRKYCNEWPGFEDKAKPIIDAVDQVLREKGITEKEASDLFINFQAEAQLEIMALKIKGPVAQTSFADRVKFFKLCLEVFNILVEKFKFDPQKLWA